MEPIIYMDHAATTCTHPEVLRAMQPYFHDRYGNPSGIYKIARENREAIQTSRKMIADTLHTKPECIYFTAGGSESDNWALKETARAYAKKGRHIITTKIEHHGILHTAEYLERCGFEVTYLDVDEQGLVNPLTLMRAIRDDTILISVMFANNEIGTIEPIAEIGRIAHRHNILFHTDAVQAYGQLPINVDAMHIDLLSASGHKLNGPKGIGFLYIRDGLLLDSFIHGGAQENGRRAGTENIPGIIGLGKAAQIAQRQMQEKIKKESRLRDYMIRRLLSEIPYTRLNGHRTKRLPNNINVSFQFVDSEAVLVMLDSLGICASGGSACNASSKKASHVLTAIGLPESLARGSIRLTLGSENTKEEADYVIACLKDIVEGLRENSPQYEDYMRRS